MPSPGATPDLRTRLGGRWAISRQAFALTVVLALLLLALSAPTATESLQWLAVGAVALAGVGAWVYLMHRTIFRDRQTEPVSLVWVVISDALASAIFVGITVGAGFLAGINDGGDVAPSPVITWFIAFVWGFIVVLTLESHWRFHAQREVLVEQAVQQRLITLQEMDVLEQIRGVVDAAVDEQLVTARRRVDARIQALLEENPADVRSLAAELRSTADAIVRPLSHRLAEDSRSSHPSPGLWSALRGVTRYQPYRPLVVAAIYVLTTAPKEWQDRGPVPGSVVVLLTVLLIVGLMSLVNLAMRRWPRHHSALFLGGLFVVQLPYLGLIPVLGAPLGTPVPWFDAVAAVVFGSLLIVITSSFGAWNRTREELIQRFAQEVRDDEIEALARGRAVVEVARAAALVLHGRVQSQLRACAAALEQASAGEDVAGMNRALVQARAILEQPVAATGLLEPSSLGSLVELRASEWAGLVLVRLDVDAWARDLDGAVAMHVADVVEEAIANAVHHGGATEVDIRLHGDGQVLELVVTDNGRGPQQGSSGLGSRLMGGLGGQWRLEASGAGSILTVRLPGGATSNV